MRIFKQYLDKLLVLNKTAHNTGSYVKPFSEFPNLTIWFKGIT
jgi:hypothetical protein